MPRCALPAALAAVLLSPLLCLHASGADPPRRRLLVVPVISAEPVARAEAERHGEIAEALTSAVRDGLPADRVTVSVLSATDARKRARALASVDATAALARAVAADYALVGKYLIRGETIRVEAHLVPATATAPGGGVGATTVMVEGPVARLEDVQRELVDDVLWALDVAEQTPAEAEPAPARKPTPEPGAPPVKPGLGGNGGPIGDADHVRLDVSARSDPTASGNAATAAGGNGNAIAGGDGGGSSLAGGHGNTITGGHGTAIRGGGHPTFNTGHIGPFVNGGHGTVHDSPRHTMGPVDPHVIIGSGRETPIRVGPWTPKGSFGNTLHGLTGHTFRKTSGNTARGGAGNTASGGERDR